MTSTPLSKDPAAPRSYGAGPCEAADPDLLPHDPARRPGPTTGAFSSAGPSARAAASRRGYFVTLAAHAAHNPDAHAFAGWLQAEAGMAASLVQRRA